ncbi:MAG: putative small rane protein [Verrucomicrobiales bacterium]|nr:putative small rane protein [Verrucomicrobiales bacterium]
MLRLVARRFKGNNEAAQLTLMTANLAIRVAGIVGFFAVALGAFGAHGFKDLLLRNNTTEIYHTAVLYHLVHAVVLLILALRTPMRSGPFLSFLSGVLIFSGSLYLLAITNMRWLGAITPFGGVCFLVGWAWMVFAPERK